MFPGVRPEGWLRCSAHPSGGVVCRGHALYPAFAPGSSEMAVGFFGLLYLLSRICPNCACRQLFLVPYSFLVFCCWRRGVSRCQHCSKGSQVPAGLKPKQLSTKRNCEKQMTDHTSLWQFGDGQQCPMGCTLPVQTRRPLAGWLIPLHQHLAIFWPGPLPVGISRHSCQQVLLSTKRS